MLGLLGLVALASRAGRPLAGGADRAREPSTAVWDYALTLWAVVMLLGAALVVYGLLLRRGEGQAARRTNPLAVLAYGALVLALVLALRALPEQREARREPSAAPSIPRVTTVPARSEPRAEPYEPEFRWLPVALLAGLGLATVFLVARAALGRERRLEASGEDELAEELGSILDQTLDDLRAEPEPRRAVIAAYARMERALAAYGLPRRRAEAPLEYLDRVARALHEPHRPARRLLFELTHLFERAKFSPHEIDVEMKEDAIATLGSLRDELRGAAA